MSERPLNIYALSRLKTEESFNFAKKNFSLAHSKCDVQIHEIQSLKYFVDNLLKHGLSIADMDDFFYSLYYTTYRKRI